MVTSFGGDSEDASVLRSPSPVPCRSSMFSMSTSQGWLRSHDSALSSLPANPATSSPAISSTHSMTRLRTTRASSTTNALEWRLVVESRIGQQAAQFIPDHRVAFAGAGLQSGALEHFNSAAAIVDEACALQPASGRRDALAAHAEHAGDQLLRHDHLARADAIDRQQQPAAQLLLDEMVPVAGGRLQHLCDQRLGIAQQQALHRA